MERARGALPEGGEMGTGREARRMERELERAEGQGWRGRRDLCQRARCVCWGDPSGVEPAD